VAELSEIAQLANRLRSALAVAERSTGKLRLQSTKDGLEAIEQIKKTSRAIKDKEGRANMEKFERRLHELLPIAVRETIVQLIDVVRSPKVKPEIRPKAIDAIRMLLKEHKLSPSNFGITEGNLITWQTTSSA